MVLIMFFRLVVLSRLRIRWWVLLNRWLFLWVMFISCESWWCILMLCLCSRCIWCFISDIVLLGWCGMCNLGISLLCLMKNFGCWFR